MVFGCSFLDNTLIFLISIKFIWLFGLKPQTFLLNGTLVFSNFRLQAFLKWHGKYYCENTHFRLFFASWILPLKSFCLTFSFFVAMNLIIKMGIFFRKGSYINHVDSLGEGVSQMNILLHKPYLVKVTTKGGGHYGVIIILLLPSKIRNH